MPLFFIKEANYLEILENTTEIIKTTISRKLKNKKTGEEFEVNFTKNSSFNRAAWDKTYAEIQKTWAELDSMKKEFKNNKIIKIDHDQKSIELNKKLRTLEEQENKAFLEGRPYLWSTDFIIGESLTGESWLIENIFDEEQKSMFLSKKWFLNLKDQGITNYKQIEDLKLKDERLEFIVFYHPEKEVAFRQKGKKLGNSTLHKFEWFFQSLSGMWFKFKKYWSEEAIAQREHEKKLKLEAKLRYRKNLMHSEALNKNTKEFIIRQQKDSNNKQNLNNNHRKTNELNIDIDIGHQKTMIIGNLEPESIEELIKNEKI